MSDPFNTAGAPGAAPNPFAPQTPTAAPQQVNGAAQTGNAAGVPDAPQEIIDLNDPRLTSEALVNTEGDAYATPAPPPAGKYRVKLKLEGLKHDGSDAAKQMWPGKAQGDTVPYLPKTHRDRSGQVDQVYLYTTISATITDPKFPQYEGVPVFDSWVGTFQGRDGSTKVATILSRLQKPDNSPWVAKGEKLNQLAWMDRFAKALSGEPEAGVEVDWEWSCQGCGQEAKAQHKEYPNSIVGMNKFPIDQKSSRPGVPVYVPEMQCQVNRGHQYSKARTRIVGFLGLGELK